jgi:uncharacterized membrane protein
MDDSTNSTITTPGVALRDEARPLGQAQSPATPPHNARPAGDRLGAARLIGIDAARGLALFGMIAVHVLPNANADETGLSPPYAIASGRSAATFAVLAGVGLALATGGTRRPVGSALRSHRAGVAARAVAIAAIGLVVGFAAAKDVGVILVYYGVFFLLALPLLGLRSRTLAWLALGTAIAVPVVSHAVRDYLPEPFERNPNWHNLLTDPLRVLSELTVTGLYPGFAWLAYIAAGLAVGRLALRDRKIQLTLVGVGLALAVGARVLSWVLLDKLGGAAAIEAATVADVGAAEFREIWMYGGNGITPTSTWWWLTVDLRHTSTPLDLIHTTGVALAVLGLLLFVERWIGRLLRPLAAAGAMTLTIYAVHVVLLNSGWLPADPEISFLLQVACFVAVAMLWLQRFGRGPLEAVVSAFSTIARRVASPLPAELPAGVQAPAYGATARINALGSQATPSQADPVHAKDQLQEVDGPPHAVPGSRTEQGPRSAEEQVSDIVAAATADANELRTAARAEVDSQYAAAMTEIEDRLSAAQQQAEALIEAARGESKELREKAAHEAAQLRATAKRELDELRAAARQEAEELLTRASAHLEAARARAKQETKELEEALVTRREEEERRDAEITAAAEKTRRQADEEAAALMDNARRRADSLLADAGAQAKQMLDGARREAEQIRSDAQRTVDEVTRQRNEINEQLAELQTLLATATSRLASGR